MVMKIVSLPTIFRVLCGVQSGVGVGLRGSVEPAVQPVDEESFGEFSAVRCRPGVRFAGFKLKVDGLVSWVCLKV